LFENKFRGLAANIQIWQTLPFADILSLGRKKLAKFLGLKKSLFLSRSLPEPFDWKKLKLVN